MNESPEDLAAVEQLLAESESLRSWLARLELASASAPSAVRDRVRADYQRRLDDLTAGLRAHGDVIAAKLSDDRAEHDALAARAQAAHDALSEAELRHMVGEYDDERFGQERHQHSGDIETFELSLHAVAERIDRLAQIHGMVTDGGRPLATMQELMTETTPAGTAEAVVDDQPVTVTAAPLFDAQEQLPIADEPVGIADLAPDGEEHDDLLSVFDEQVIAVEIEEEPASPPMPVATPEIGPLSFRPTGVGGGAAPPARPRSFDSAPPLGMPADQPPRFVRPGERMTAPAAATPPVADNASRDAIAPPARPSAAPADAPMPTATQVHEAAAAMQVGRTLRCAECGAMNRPLEWYCEKCGAELMAM
ncbi:MAG TPA: hypothetical protein VGM77_13795 [Gemmatimonadales bacterium]|jgi:hypothetical protein